MKLSSSTFFEAFSPRVLSASVLCYLALACWAGSLFLTALGSSTAKVFTGMEVLLAGWGAIFFANFAWLANLLFITALLRVLNQRKSDGLALWAFVFSLDAFRLSEYLQNEGGSFAKVYGFGWGAVLWWLAMTLIMAASGSLPDPDPDEGSVPAQWTPLRPVGLALFGIVVVCVAFTAVSQRSAASSFEQKKLSAYAFKRTSVCTREVSDVRVRLPQLSGPLLLKLSTDRSEGLYAFNQPRVLLRWGIPSIRIEGQDFRLRHLDGEQMLVSSPAKGPAGATLTVRRSGAQLDVDLTTSDGHVAFAQKWLKLPDGQECPEYWPVPKPEEPPRRLLVESLGIGSPAELPPASWPSSIHGTLVARTDSLSKANPNPDMECPANTGWVNQPVSKFPSSFSLPRGFRVSEHIYYPERLEGFRARCIGRSIFLHKIVGMRKEGLKVLLQKRDSTDFRLISAAAIDIDAAVMGADERGLQIIGISEEDGGVTLSIIRPVEGSAVLIKAELASSS